MIMSESVKNLWYFFFAFLAFGLWTIPILIVLVGVARFYLGNSDFCSTFASIIKMNTLIQL